MFVPDLCNFYYDKLGCGHTMSSRLGGIPVPISRDYVYVAYPFFMRLRNISNRTYSIDMKNRTKEALCSIAANVPKQSVSEIYAILSSVCDELDILLSRQYFLYPDGVIPASPIPLVNIYGVLLSNSYLYLLLKNGVFHCFERATGNHEVCFFDNYREGFFDYHLN